MASHSLIERATKNETKASVIKNFHQETAFLLVCRFLKSPNDSETEPCLLKSQKHVEVTRFDLDAIYLWRANIFYEIPI